MLDQNTDRMWYVIGAVIVGAAIIFLVNSSFPQLFASVGDTFMNKSNDVSHIIDSIDPNIEKVDITYLGQDDVHISDGSFIDSFNESDHMWTLNIMSVDKEAPWHMFGGLRMNTRRFIVPFNKNVSLTYEVYVDRSVTNAYAVTDINTEVLDRDIPNWNGNDNDINRRYNGTTNPKVALKGGEWNTITVNYANKSEKNIAKTALYDRSHIGVQQSTGELLGVNIRNARIVIEE